MHRGGACSRLADGIPRSSLTYPVTYNLSLWIRFMYVYGPFFTSSSTANALLAFIKLTVMIITAFQLLLFFFVVCCS